MTRTAVRSLVALMMAGAVFVGLSGSTANGLTPTKTSSFVGTYQFHATIGGMTHAERIVLNAQGQAIDPNGQIAQWTSSGKTITIDYSAKGDTEHWVGHQSKKGIGSKKHPGTVTTSFGDGTWYAIKLS